MDREHPIPQEVSTYEFRLVGDMTIKQFMQVAAGALISLVIYSSNMEPYVKWPLILISFLSGIALAFFPIEDRPLSKWIVLFIKAIYSPTIYVWDKNAREFSYFQPETDDANAQLPPTANVASTQLTNAPSQPSLQTVPTPTEDHALDQKEQEFLNKVDQQFTSNQTPVSQTEQVSLSMQTPPAANAIPTPIATHITATDDSSEQLGQSAPQTVMHADVKVPETSAPIVQSKPKETVYESPASNEPQSQVGGEITPLATNINPQAQQATFSSEASPPTPPTMPNVIVGQVLTPDGNIVDGAILEIKDEQGRSVRALRSNRLGHFMIVTPLVNGKYTIDTEKEGLHFDPVSVETTDRVIPPIAIWAKKQD